MFISVQNTISVRFHCAYLHIRNLIFYFSKIANTWTFYMLIWYSIIYFYSICFVQAFEYVKLLIVAICFSHMWNYLYYAKENSSAYGIWYLKKYIEKYKIIFNSMSLKLNIPFIIDICSIKIPRIFKWKKDKGFDTIKHSISDIYHNIFKITWIVYK